MKIVGLSGGIASGKNFVAEIFAQNGAAIFDADSQVHYLLKEDKSVILEVKKHFPESFADQKIDRKILGKIVFSNQDKLDILEKIIHPKVKERYQEFLKKSQSENRKIAILNIPLLLEKDGYKFDKIIAITTSPSIQKKRFLARARKSNIKNFTKEKGQLEKKFEQIRSKQITNSQRKQAADFVINSSFSKAKTISQTKQILSLLQN